MKTPLILCLLQISVLAGCTTDIFNSSCRKIAKSGYSLCRNSDGPQVFYLEPNHQEASGGGVLDGVVQTIGWDEKVIIASRKATFSGDPDGLMVVDLSNKKIYGPTTPSALAKMYPNIRLIKASDAWESLKW
jgi:hypothetical protein